MRAVTSVLTKAAVGGLLALNSLLAAPPLAAARDGLPYSYSTRQVRVQGYSIHTERVTVTRFYATTWSPTPYGVYPVFVVRDRARAPNPGVPRSTVRAEPSVEAYHDWQREMWRARRPK